MALVETQGSTHPVITMTTGVTGAAATHGELHVIETPYSARNPWQFAKNLQYAVLANYHANKAYGCTWVPQMCNTQFVYCGVMGYMGDFFGAALQPWLSDDYTKWDLGRTVLSSPVPSPLATFRMPQHSPPRVHPTTPEKYMIARSFIMTNRRSPGWECTNKHGGMCVCERLITRVSDFTEHDNGT